MSAAGTVTTSDVAFDRGDRGGFVLALVVLMLFAIAVAGATGYVLVSTEYSMAKNATEGAEALSVARAGLHRFTAEQLGAVESSVSYGIGSGVATVTSRKLAELDSLNHLYYIRSEGTVTDPLLPDTPARRVVGAYAYYRRRPLRHWAAMVVAAQEGYATGGLGRVNGNDEATASDCTGGGATPIPGIIAQYFYGTTFGGSLDGSPQGLTWSGGYPAVYDSVGLRWDVLTDPNLPLEYDGVMPNFASLPADSFPVVRLTGASSLGAASSGRGALIVDGEFNALADFQWEGIVLAGSADDAHQGDIHGMLVAGLDGPNPYNEVYWGGTLRYNSCNVYAANEALSYLELIEDTEFEPL